MRQPSPYDLEKQKIAERLESLERKVDESGSETKKMFVKIYGDEDANPPIKGHEERLKALELEKEGRDKQKDLLIKIAVGSITFAVGGFVLWVCAAIKAAFIKGN